MEQYLFNYTFGAKRKTNQHTNKAHKVPEELKKKKKKTQHKIIFIKVNSCSNTFGTVKHQIKIKHIKLNKFTFDCSKEKTLSIVHLWNNNKNV